MFLLVLAYLCSAGQNPESRKMVVAAAAVFLCSCCIVDCVIVDVVRFYILCLLVFHFFPQY